MTAVPVFPMMCVLSLKVATLIAPSTTPLPLLYKIMVPSPKPPVEPVPIVTPPCPWDLDDDGIVGITDFLSLLAQWGSNPGGPPDFDGDGTVGITDFLELLAHWGLCPP